jgi:hypothetical protein
MLQRLAGLALLLVAQSTQAHKIGFFADMRRDGLITPGSRERENSGKQAAIAAIRAVELINLRNASIVGSDQGLVDQQNARNMTLEIEIIDTKGQLPTAQLALVNALRFNNITSMVGPPLSDFCLSMAAVAEAFGVPLVSFWASSLDLTSELYPFFARTWPSDSILISAALGLLRHYDWNHVVTFVPNNEWGTDLCLTIERNSSEVFIGPSGREGPIATTCLYYESLVGDVITRSKERDGRAEKKQRQLQKESLEVCDSIHSYTVHCTLQ